MAQVLVRDLEPEVLASLKARAERNGRSLQRELKMILEEAARANEDEFRRRLERLNQMLGGRRFDDSAPSIREDRDR